MEEKNLEMIEVEGTVEQKEEEVKAEPNFTTKAKEFATKHKKKLVIAGLAVLGVLAYKHGKKKVESDDSTYCGDADEVIDITVYSTEESAE